MGVSSEDIKLIEEGFFLNKINELTGTSKSSLYHHYKKIKGRKFKKVIINKSNEENIGEFLGIFAGDGNFYKDLNYHYRVRITIGAHEKPYVDFLTGFFHKIFSKKPILYIDNTENKVVISYNSKKIYHLLREYLDWGENKTKTIKLRKLNHHTHFLIGFLRGLFDTDGGIYRPKNKVAYGTSSKELALQIKELLTRFGMKPGFYKYKGKDFWYIDLYGPRTVKFMNNIKPHNYNKQL